MTRRVRLLGLSAHVQGTRSRFYRKSRKALHRLFPKIRPKFQVRGCLRRQVCWWIWRLGSNHREQPGPTRHYDRARRNRGRFPSIYQLRTTSRSYLNFQPMNWATPESSSPPNFPAWYRWETHPRQRPRYPPAGTPWVFSTRSPLRL